MNLSAWPGLMRPHLMKVRGSAGLHQMPTHLLAHLLAHPAAAQGGRDSRTDT